MNVLPFEKQVSIIAALTEGCSIRAVERLTGVHRDTIMRLAVRVGIGCAKLHDALMRDVYVSRCELDELRSYVGKKRKNVTPDDPTWMGDQYVFIALDATSKGILSYTVGKRNQINASRFLRDLKGRVANVPEISTDAWSGYPGSVEEVFGHEVSYGIVEKKYAVGGATPEASRRYRPADVVGVKYHKVLGAPKKISTSYVERQNLTMRMQNRRFTRLTNAFSKKIENHMAATALYAFAYNFCRIHEAIRITPAMHLKATDHVWTISELVEAALNGTIETKPEGRRAGPFRVIEGGA